MTLLRLSPMLSTDDLESSVKFYQDILEFRCELVDHSLGWASLWRDQINIMFGLPNAHLPWSGPRFTGSLYLYCDNIEQQWQQIHDQVEICYPLSSFSYGMREFGFYDNNRYLLKFGQPLNEGTTSGAANNHLHRKKNNETL